MKGRLCGLSLLTERRGCACASVCVCVYMFACCVCVYASAVCSVCVCVYTCVCVFVCADFPPCAFADRGVWVRACVCVWVLCFSLQGKRPNNGARALLAEKWKELGGPGVTGLQLPLSGHQEMVTAYFEEDGHLSRLNCQEQCKCRSATLTASLTEADVLYAVPYKVLLFLLFFCFFLESHH